MARTATMASGELVANTIQVPTLSQNQVEQMWKLFSYYYASVSREAFLKDLNEKDHVFLLTDSGSGFVKGFSTVKVYHRRVEKKPLVVIFSGDTIVDRKYWGQKALHKAFYKYLIRVKLENPTMSVYWFLISKGYKTYLGMSRNFLRFWPRMGVQTPSAVAKLIDHLASDRYGEAWDPGAGVLKFEDCPGKLKEEVAPIDQKLLSDPDIRFFVEKNPGHMQGDELCCVAQVNVGLFASYPLKLVKKRFTQTRKRIVKWAFS